mmetsp:Transcript_46148/g.142219  ORF Transcript_46148/g.142219 Transcript_46148/m.142219 type:complete len:219 (-) Transcript_46148:628-1284(-)
MAEAERAAVVQHHRVQLVLGALAAGLPRLRRHVRGDVPNFVVGREGDVLVDLAHGVVEALQVHDEHLGQAVQPRPARNLDDAAAVGLVAVDLVEAAELAGAVVERLPGDGEVEDAARLVRVARVVPRVGLARHPLRLRAAHLAQAPQLVLAFPRHLAAQESADDAHQRRRVLGERCELAAGDEALHERDLARVEDADRELVRVCLLAGAEVPVREQRA